MFDAVIAWLLTYALHSTMFLALAALASRRLAQRMPAVEETVWRFALVAGLATASLQLAVGREPLVGSWHLETSARSAVSAPAPSATVSRLPRALEARTADALPAPPQVEASTESLSVSLPAALAGIWLAGALLLASVWLAGYLRLRRRLRPRPQVLEATMVSLLGELRERAGLRQPVRLSCSSRLPVPVALGMRRPEICVPPRALAGLAPEQQEGMLAHELAHLVRRDPFWLAFGRLLASVLFFQPLNWIAVRRLRELSELLCDEWAVGRTGRPVSLARCLAEVAGWSVQPLGSLPAPGMADRPSNLARRIRRLLEEARSPQRKVHPAWLAAGMLTLVVAVAAAAPGVQAAVAGNGSEAAVLAQASAEAPDREEAPPPRPSEEPALAADDEMDEDIELDADDLVPDDLGDRIQEELDRSLEALNESPWEMAAMDMELDPLDEESAMAAAMADAEMSESEAEEIERRYEELSERISKQVEEQLEPKVKELEKLVEQHTSRFENSEEMRQLERRAEQIAERARPSEEEMAKLQAEIEKMRADGGMSAEDKQKIREEARRMAQAHRLTDKDRAEIDEMRRQAHEMAQRSMREHQPEIDQMRRQIQEEARAIREEVRRQLENDPQLRELRERSRKERERTREERERHREQMRQDRERAPRPPRPERHVQLHIAPEVQVQVEPAVAAAMTRVDVTVAPAVAPMAPLPPRVRMTVRPATAPVARRNVDVQVKPAVAPVAQPTPRPTPTPKPTRAPKAAPTPEPTSAPAAAPAAAPEPPGR
jgi:beta-lactamase regulating signal transducer with metallopeptidase domain